MAHLNFLEQFETEGGADAFNPPMQDLPGYDAGYEAGLADAALQNKQLSAGLVDRLTEMRFGYAEAQQALFAAIEPFVTALSDQILPALTDDLTRAHIKEALLIAAQGDIANPITLTFHPQTANLVRDVVTDVAGVEVLLNEDVRLGVQEVYIGASHSETQLDIDGLIRGVQSALSNIAVSPGGDQRNG